MRKLNPITALYLKILEFISFLLIEFVERFDNFFNPKGLTQSELRNRQITARNHQRFWKRTNSFWSD